MIDFFGVSADVLLGLAEYCEAQAFLPVPPFGDRLRKVMQETHTTQYGIEKELRISGGTMYAWLTNKSVPTVDSLVRLAKYLDCSIDYLLGRIK